MRRSPLPFSRRELLARLGFGALCLLVGAAVLMGALALLRSLSWRGIDDDISPLREGAPLSVQTAPLAAEKSGEYAVIAMTGQALGYPVTEESLLEENGGRISCGGPEGFAEQLGRSLPGFTAEARLGLTNTEFLLLCREQLAMGIPVPFDYLDEGAPRPGLIISLDLPSDEIVVLTSAGEERVFVAEDLLAATRLEGESSFPLWVGILTGSYAKNTLYVLSPRA